MKKLSLLIILLLTGISLVFSQDEDPEKREKMMKEVQEFKMKYLAQEMELSEVQKKKFFELYEEMEESKRDCYKSAVVLAHQYRENPNSTEEDYQKVRAAFNQANAQWTEIENSYDEKFSEFLSRKQIYKMKEAEASFRAKMDEMKHNRKKDHPKEKGDKKNHHKKRSEKKD